MKLKLFVVAAICMVFLISSVSSLEWDNVKNYDEETKTVDIRNSILGIPFLQLGKVAEVKLDTPIHMDLAPGYQKVGQFTITSYEDYTDALKSIKFLDVKDGNKEFVRNYDFKYRYYENINVSDKSYVCNEVFSVKNNSIGEECGFEIVGSHIESQERWGKLGTTNLSKNEVLVVGIFTTVQTGDYVDWVPSMFGIEVKEWATFASFLEVDLVEWWKFEEGTGSNATGELGNYILVANSSTWVTGKSGTGLNFSRASGEFAATSENVTEIANSNMSINGWYRLQSFPGATASVIKFGRNFNNAAESACAISTFVTVEEWGIFCPNTFVEVFSSTGDIDTFVMMTIVFDDSTNNFTLFRNGDLIGTMQKASNLLEGTFDLALNPQGNTMGLAVDEIGIWNRTLNQSEIDLLYDGGNGTFFGAAVRLNSPAEGFTTFNNSVTFNVTPLQGGLVNVSIVLDGIINQTNSSGLNGTDHIFIIDGISVANHNWTAEVCDNITCSTSNEVRNFTVSNRVENEFFFNISTFQTAEEIFTVNLTTNGSVPIDATFIYGGTEFSSATIINTIDNDFNITRTISVPGDVLGNQTFFFNFTLDSEEISTSSNDQILNPTNFTLCSATETVPYINITFRNETINEENLTATISSTWLYSLGDIALSNKTLIFSNSSENSNYTFCTTPGNRSLNINLTMVYNNADSQQRNFLLERVLTNLSTTQVLYLLPTTLGLFTQFRTITGITGDSLADVSAVFTRILNGVVIGVGSLRTDSSGFLSIFLNPDVTYTVVFSKTGFQDNAFSFVPTTDIRTVSMSGGVEDIANGTVIIRGTNYTITPGNTTLNNNTNITFGFNVTSNQTITFISMNISNSTGAQLLLVTSSSSGFISGIVNTSGNTQLFGNYIIQTSGEIITLQRTWTIQTLFQGDYSIFKQLSLVPGNELIGMFMRLLLVILAVLGVLIFMTATEIIDTSESKIIVALLLIWGFSLVGWLDTGLVVNATDGNISNLGKLSSQFGIAMLSTMAGLYFILRRIF